MIARFEHIRRFAVPIETKETKDPTRASAYDIQLLVRRNQTIAEQRCGDMSVRKQAVVAEHLRHHA